MQKFEPLQASLKVVAVSGIFKIWSNFTIEAFKFACHIISTSPEKNTYKASFKASVKIAENFTMMTSIT